MILRITFQEAHSWGIQIQNGSSNGAIGMLINNETDLVAAELIMTTERLNDVEYTTPVYSTKYLIFFENTKKHI